jgi:hypothetical protein
LSITVHCPVLPSRFSLCSFESSQVHDRIWQPVLSTCFENTMHAIVKVLSQCMLHDCLVIHSRIVASSKPSHGIVCHPRRQVSSIGMQFRISKAAAFLCRRVVAAQTTPRRRPRFQRVSLSRKQLRQPNTVPDARTTTRRSAMQCTGVRFGGSIATDYAHAIVLRMSGLLPKPLPLERLRDDQYQTSVQ